MSGRPFRFIHASDLHLERVPRGLVLVPDHLRDLLIDAPLEAATRVFDAVLAEEADFLILAGDVISPRTAGPRGLVFLLEQFSRLAERGIGIYWAGGRVDRPEVWPTALRLPDNVRVFPQNRVEEFVVRRDGLPLARVLGTSHDGKPRTRVTDFPAEHTQLYSIGVAYGAADANRLAQRAVHYWALGGRHERATVSTQPQVVHYPGTPLGRSPAEEGAHGCTLVQVDEQGRAKLALVPTDPLRWQHERLIISDKTSAESLLTKLREQMQAIVAAAPGVNLLVSWTIAGDGPLVMQLRRGGLAGELIATLRTEFGHASPSAWTTTLEVESGPVGADLYGQETILGDFLRAVRRHEDHADLPLDLQNYLSERQLAGALQSAALLEDEDQRRRVLREAAHLAADLFSAEDAAT